MIPTWFRVLVAAQIAGLVVLVVLGVRIALAGASGVGEVISWATPHLGQVTQPAPIAPLGLPGSTAPPTAPPLPILGGPLLARLDSDTASTAAGELRIIQAIEASIRDRVTTVLTGVSHR